MIVFGFIVVFSLLIVWRRRRAARAMTHAGLVADKPQFMVSPPLRTLTDRKGERL